MKLKEVVDANPESLTALAVLYWAGHQAGQPGLVVETKKQLMEGPWFTDSGRYEQLTRYDKFFLCLTSAVHGTPDDMKVVIDRLDRLIEKDRWGAAYAVRTTAKTECAMESQNKKDFEGAVADAETAVAIVPNSTFVQSSRLDALTCAIEFANDQELDAEQWIRWAEDAAEKLGDQPSAFEISLRAAFFKAIGQVERAADEENAYFQLDTIPLSNRTAELLRSMLTQT